MYSKFNLQVKNLPKTLTHIHFDKFFNNSIEFPDSFEYITFVGGDFNQKIDKYPKSLVYIEFGSSYNYPLNNLPYGLKKLKLGDGHIHSLDFLPNSLLFLEIGGRFNNSINNLPSSLKQLHFCCFSDFNKPIDKLPESLEYLNFGNRFNNEIKTYPPNLKYVSFGSNFNKPIDNITSQHIFLGNYNCPINITNTKVEYLCFGEAFNGKIINLPSNIHLYFTKPTANILNNLPLIKKCAVVLSNLSEEITNLPTSMNELILIHLETDNILVDENKKYIIKVPFDCELSTMKLKEYTKHHINYVHEQMCPTY